MPADQSRRQTLKQLTAAAAAVALPGGLAGCTGARRDADVIVVGAGLAGLNAALLLREQGLDVLVVEASGRTGGRVYTLDDQPHRPDAGGSEFSLVSYARILDRIEKLGLKQVPWRGAGVEFAYHVNGQTVAAADWPTSPANLTAGSARSVPPPFLAGFYLPRPTPLATTAGWLEPDAIAYDIPYGDYLRSAGADPEAIRLAEARGNSDTINEMSTLFKMRSAKFTEASGGLDQLRNLEGGMSRLTDGMAGLIQRPIVLNTPVTRMETMAGGVELTDATGKIWRAGYAVCTVPLTLLRTMDIVPALPPTQDAAVQETPYDDHVEVYFDVLEPFWEVDGLPPSLWTDSELGLVLHLADADTNGCLWLAIAGPASRGIRGLDDATIMARIGAELERVRPSTAGRIKPMTVHNWSAYPWTRGHVAYRAPGQIAAFGNAGALPHGRIHFAGEHTAAAAVGMEGAMESGERAAVEILSRSL